MRRLRGIHLRAQWVGRLRGVADLRDYEQWHEAYDDPISDLSWRLRTVQRLIEQALDSTTGPLRVLSSCAGDGRDVLEVLARRADGARVTATLLEIHPALVERARDLAAGAAAHVTVRLIDAGNSDAYRDSIPADLVLLIGIFGNISDDDLRTTIATAPQFCRPGATLLWSRGRDRGDLNDEVRMLFQDAGFAELDYQTLDTGSRPAVGAVKYQGDPQPLIPDQHLFTFWR